MRFIFFGSLLGAQLRLLFFRLFRLFAGALLRSLFLLGGNIQNCLRIIRNFLFQIYLGFLGRGRFRCFRLICCLTVFRLGLRLPWLCRRITVPGVVLGIVLAADRRLLRLFLRCGSKALRLFRSRRLRRGCFCRFIFRRWLSFDRLRLDRFCFDPLRLNRLRLG